MMELSGGKRILTKRLAILIQHSDGRTEDGRTDGRADGRTDGQTDRQTDGIAIYPH